jgi:hypothetical protein
MIEFVLLSHTIFNSLQIIDIINIIDILNIIDIMNQFVDEEKKTIFILFESTNNIKSRFMSRSTKKNILEDFDEFETSLNIIEITLKINLKKHHNYSKENIKNSHFIVMKNFNEFKKIINHLKNESRWMKFIVKIFAYDDKFFNQCYEMNKTIKRKKFKKRETKKFFFEI